MTYDPTFHDLIGYLSVKLRDKYSRRTLLSRHVLNRCSSKCRPYFEKQKINTEFLLNILQNLFLRDRDSVDGIATHYGLDGPVRGSNPGEDEIFRTRPDQSWGPPSLLHNGYRVSFLGVKRSGRDVNHPPPPPSRA